MPVPLKSAADIVQLRQAGRIVAEAFQMLEGAIKPGVRLRDLDQLTEAFLKSRGAQTLYKGYRGNPPNNPPFPGVICASINNEICHGFPDNRVLHEGDIVGIDIGVRYKGYCGDACVTYPVGQITPEAQRLLDIAKECLRLGIAAAKPNAYLNDIGAAIEAYAKTENVGVVREWGGHGVGRSLHEPPSVLHVAQQDRGPKLRPGMVFTIEPMINAGRHEWKLLSDRWTVVTADNSLSAQFEHTIAITDKGTEILTQL